MNNVTKTQIAKAKQMDLLTYLKHFGPNNLVRKGQDYCTKEHDSLSVSQNGLWNWCSAGIGGKTALKYLIDVKGMNFVDAVLLLCNEPIQVLEPQPILKMEKQRKSFELPKAYCNNKKVITYLKKRGIAGNVIDHCINRKLIYESNDYHNAVFVGYDEKGIPRYGALRGTWELAKNQYKGEITGSDKRYSFKLQGNNDKLIVAESAIDVLSVLSLKQDFNHHYLSIGGAYAPTKENSDAKLPMALTTYLAQNANIKEIILCLDNDATGRGASQHYGKKLAYKGYKVSSRPPQKDKDYNELISKTKSPSSYER